MNFIYLIFFFKNVATRNFKIKYNVAHIVFLLDGAALQFKQGEEAV